MVALNKAYDMFNAKYGKGNILITDPAWHTVQHGIYEEIPGLGVWVRSAFANDVGNLYVEEFSKFMSQLLSSYPISNYNYLK